MVVRVPFIQTQAVYHLDPEVQDPKYWLHPDRFRQTVGIDTRDSGVDGAARENPWRPLEREQGRGRRELFLNPAVRRLCLVDSGGYGKTTALRHIAISMPAPQIAICIELNDLPLNAGADQVLEVFANRFRRAGRNSGVGTELLRKMLRAGRLTCCIDGLDQTNAKEYRDQIRSLKQFLSTADYSDRLRIIMAGRPHAVMEFWDDLFSATSQVGRQHPWQFARLSDFDDTERQHFLGPRHYQHLQQRGLAGALSPRALWMVRQIESDADLQRLNSESDIWWYVLYGNNRNATDGMLDKAAKVKVAREQQPAIGKDEILQRLAMIAWGLVRTEQRGGLSGKKTVDKFLMGCFKRHGSEFPRDDADRFLSRTTTVVCLNESLEPGVLDPDCGVDRIHFSNQSHLEFLAALWLSRWAAPEDHQWCRDHLPLKNGPDWLRNIWNYVTGMSETTLREYEPTWLATISPLFRPVPELCHPRPTEWLYRCWRRLLSYAYLNRDDWPEVSVPAIRCELETFHGRGKDKVAEKAMLVLTEFRQKSATTQQIVSSIPYVWCPPQAKAGPVDASLRTFMMGTPEENRGHKDFGEWLPEPDHVVTVALAFELQVSPVTNVEYEQFDAWHKSRRDEHSNQDHQPVIYVSLFDSMMYGCWMGPEYRLPTEKEWEFACRADSPAGQLRWWADDDDPSKRWAHDNSGGRVPESTLAHANGWGVQDQIGTVWEWTCTRTGGTVDQIFHDDAFRRRQVPSACVDECRSRFGNPSPAFVLRGGAWVSSVATDLRCCRRGSGRPASTNRNTGCRLSRVARARKS